MVSVEIPKSLKFRSGAIAPDGGSVVYVAEERSDEQKAGTTGEKFSTRAYHRKLDSYTPEPLKGTEGVRNMFFSPDGRWLGFLAPVSQESGKLRIMKVPADGWAISGDANKVLWSPCAWTPDGKAIIFFQRGEGEGEVTSLRLVLNFNKGPQPRPTKLTRPSRCSFISAPRNAPEPRGEVDKR